MVVLRNLCAALLLLAHASACNGPQREPAAPEAAAPEPSQTERVLTAAKDALRHSSYGSRSLDLILDTELVRWNRWLSEYDRADWFKKTPAGKALKGKSLVVVYASPKSTYDPNANYNIITADGDAWVLMDKDDLSCAFVIRG